MRKVELDKNKNEYSVESDDILMVFKRVGAGKDMPLVYWFFKQNKEDLLLEERLLLFTLQLAEGGDFDGRDRDRRGAEKQLHTLMDAVRFYLG